MRDPFGSMQGFMSQFNQFWSNPVEYLSKRGININGMSSQDIMNNPNEIVQQMMNSGKISQEQYNWANQMSQKFSGFFK